MSDPPPDSALHPVPHAPTYIDLDKFAHQIRLLNIISAEPSIRVELETVSLHDEPTFDALSYVWGSSENQATINVDDTLMPINRNLHNALRDVYHHWAAEDSHPSHTRRLWVDAICINQCDNIEKNHQLPLMRQIYSIAKNVFAWLGVPKSGDTSTQDFDLAFKTLGIIGDELAVHGVTAPKRETSTSSGRQIGYDTLWTGKHPSIFNYKTVWDLDLDIVELTVSEEWEPPSQAWKCIVALMDQPYWTRVWIFQEIYLARGRLRFISGKNSLSLHTLKDISEWLNWLLVQPEKPRGMSANIWSDLRNWTGAGFRLFQIMNRLYQVEEYFGALASKLEREGRKEAIEKLRIEHHAILTSTLMRESFRASDHRDYVWGLLGISKLDMQTDYQNSKVQRPSMELVERWANARRDCDYQSVMRSCPLSLPDLWFLDFSLADVLGSNSPITTSKGEYRWWPCFLPSRPPKERIFQPVRDRPHRLPIFQQFFDRPFTTWAIKAGKNLACEGVMIDRVGQCGSTEPEDYEVLNIMVAFAEEKRTDRNLAFYSWVLSYLIAHPIYPTKQHASVSMQRALLSNEDPESLFESRGCDISFLLELLHVLSKTLGSFVNAQNLPLVETLTNDLRTHFGREVVDLWRPTSDLLSTGRSIPAALLAARKLRIGSTEKAYLGRFPVQSALHDEVWLLAGYNRPVVLRRIGDHHVFVGSAEIVEPLGGRTQEEIDDLKSKIEGIEIY